MSCFCIKGVYDFNIKVIDTYTLIYEDLSLWMQDSNYIIPTTYNVKMILPDESYIYFDANPLNATILRASDLGLSKFKDGIYCFLLEALNEESGACGVEKYKNTGIFPNIRCCIDSAYSTSDKKDDIKEVDSFLKDAEFSASLGKKEESYTRYVQAKRLLERLNCNCTC